MVGKFFPENNYFIKKFENKGKFFQITYSEFSITAGFINQAADLLKRITEQIFIIFYGLNGRINFFY